MVGPNAQCDWPGWGPKPAQQGGGGCLLWVGTTRQRAPRELLKRWCHWQSSVSSGRQWLPTPADPDKFPLQTAISEPQAPGAGVGSNCTINPKIQPPLVVKKWKGVKPLLSRQICAGERYQVSSINSKTGHPKLTSPPGVGKKKRLDHNDTNTPHLAIPRPPSCG